MPVSHSTELPSPPFSQQSSEDLPSGSCLQLPQAQGHVLLVLWPSLLGSFAEVAGSAHGVVLVSSSNHFNLAGRFGEWLQSTAPWRESLPYQQDWQGETVSVPSDSPPALLPASWCRRPPGNTPCTQHSASPRSPLVAPGSGCSQRPVPDSREDAAGWVPRGSQSSCRTKMTYLSLESPIQSSNNDSFPSVGHCLAELHNVWELEGIQAHCKEGWGAALGSRFQCMPRQQHQEQGKSEPCVCEMGCSPSILCLQGL